jgi:hypothetical protein
MEAAPGTFKTFSVFVRCRPLLPDEAALGAVRCPHRADTGYSCVREASGSGTAVAAYIGRAMTRAPGFVSAGATKALLVLDPDAPLGIVRCCGMHAAAATAGTSSSSSSSLLQEQQCPFERRFEADAVFGPASTNADVYGAVVRPLLYGRIDDSSGGRDSCSGGALGGRNGTLLVYGVTSSGKSRTILGDDAVPGVVEFAVRDLCQLSFFNSDDGDDGDDGDVHAVHTTAARAGPTAKSEREENPPRGNATTTTTVLLSFVELYNEQIVDLLAADDSNVVAASAAATTTHGSAASPPRWGLSQHMHDQQQQQQHVVELVEHPTRGAVLRGLTEVLVTSGPQARALLASASRRRACAATAANARSSRSHAIVTLTVTRRARDAPAETTTAKLTFVDLAGSERGDASVFAAPSAAATALSRGEQRARPRTPAAEARLRQREAADAVTLRREGCGINRSLFALGACIQALAQHSQQHSSSSLSSQTLIAPATAHIPWRDSKLTRLLRDSLGGNAVTCILATISPSVLTHAETVATLRFVATARSVSLRHAALRVNRAGDAKAADAMMRAQYRGELVRLRAEVRALRVATVAGATAAVAAARGSSASHAALTNAAGAANGADDDDDDDRATNAYCSGGDSDAERRAATHDGPDRATTPAAPARQPLRSSPESRRPDPRRTLREFLSLCEPGDDESDSDREASAGAPRRDSVPRTAAAIGATESLAPSWRHSSGISAHTAECRDGESRSTSHRATVATSAASSSSIRRQPMMTAVTTTTNAAVAVSAASSIRRGLARYGVMVNGGGGRGNSGVDSTAPSRTDHVDGDLTRRSVPSAAAPPSAQPPSWVAAAASRAESQPDAARPLHRRDADAPNAFRRTNPDTIASPRLAAVPSSTAAPVACSGVVLTSPLLRDRTSSAATAIATTTALRDATNRAAATGDKVEGTKSVAAAAAAMATIVVTSPMRRVTEMYERELALRAEWGMAAPLLSSSPASMSHAEFDARGAPRWPAEFL